jgi:UDP-N-acetylmuramate--alanine ligase
MDHVDYFKSMEHIKRSYRSFASIAGQDGCVVANADDEEVRMALSGISPRVVSFGIECESADVRAANIECKKGRYSFDIIAKGEKVCRAELSVSGYHNIYNALATAAVALECGLDGEQIKSGLKAFAGAARRMEYKGECGGVPIYDDYAHHPTEIRATLEGAKRMVENGGRLWCVFQSHTYSRTAALLDGFAESLSIADRVLVCDIYAAREENIYGVSPEKLAALIDGARAVHGFDEPAEILKRELKNGDVAIIMGAGDVWKVFERLDLK